MSTLAAGAIGMPGLKLRAGLKRTEDDWWGRASVTLEAKGCPTTLLNAHLEAVAKLDLKTHLSPGTQAILELMQTCKNCLPNLSYFSLINFASPPVWSWIIFLKLAPSARSHWSVKDTHYQSWYRPWGGMRLRLNKKSWSKICSSSTILCLREILIEFKR